MQADKKNKLLVSIVINNYNYENYLRESIDSALAQTYPRTEVVVVDDGSTDDSPEIVASYGEAVLPVLKENGGQASAFSSGFYASSGDVILFLDADDMLLPGAAQQAAEQLANIDAVKVHWPLLEVDEGGKYTGRILPGYDLLEGDVLQEVIDHGIPRGWRHGLGHAYRRSFLEEVMPVRECGDKHGADSYLCALAPIFGSIRLIKEPLGCYRTHGENFARGRKVRYRLERDARRYEFLFESINYHLSKQGHNVDTRPWFGAGSAYAWTRDSLTLIDEIAKFAEPDQPFILIDDGLLGDNYIPTARPMMELNGVYAGPPENSEAAISELKRQISTGAMYIVFAPGTFWWLDFYKDFDQYLRDRFACIAESKQLIAFNLRKSYDSPN